ncbi:phage tail tape measure protein [Kribbella sp.]|uniref:phage tail tape measure protein n=1 Tax=Kribbella sp. TaxID=1871183 RepID=UPI002D6BC0B2|nr:phage tail tape measure protein [Kribbella sp.]HZX07205.1 phage tail tape measure protein [Kribbella sp.]
MTDTLMGRALIEVLPDMKRFAGDTQRQVRSAMAGTQDVVEKPFKEASKGIKQSFTNAVSGVERGVKSAVSGVQATMTRPFKAADGVIQQDFKKTTEGMQKRTGTFARSLKGLLAPALAAFAGLGAIGFAKDSIGSFQDAGVQVLRLQRVAGGTPEQMSRLRAAAIASGISVDTLTTSAKLFSRNLVAAQGSTKKSADLVKLLGFNFKDAHGKLLPMADLLPRVADKFKSMPNGAEKTAAAIKLFGRSGTDMIPFLNKGSDGIKTLEKQSDKLGTTLSGKALTNLSHYRQQQRDFAQAMEGVKISVGGALLPLLGGLASTVGKVIPAAFDAGRQAVSNLKKGFQDHAVTAGGFAGFLQGIGSTARTMSDTFTRVALPQLKKLGDYVRDTLLPKLSDLATTGLNVAGAAARWAGDLIQGLTTGLTTGNWGPLGKAIADGVAAGLRGLGAETGKLLDAIGKLVDQVDWHALGGRVSNSFLNLVHSINWKQVGSALGDAFVTIVQKGADLGVKLGTAFKNVIQAVDWQKVGHDSTDAIGRFVSGVDWIKVFTTAVSLFARGGKINVQLGQAMLNMARDAVWGMLQSITDEMSVGRKWLVRKTQDLGGWLWSGLKSGLTSGARGLSNWLKVHVTDPVINWVKNLFGIKSPSTVFASIGIQLILGFKAGIVAAANGIGRWIYSKVISPVAAPFGKAGIWLVQHGKNMVAGFENGIMAIGGGIGSWIYNHVIVPVVRPFNPAGNWLVSHGWSLISGLLVGAQNAMKNIGNWVRTRVVNPIVGAVKSFFGIHSPSTVMAGIGSFMAQGLFQGLGSINVGKTIGKIFGGMPGALSAIVNKGLISIKGLPAKALSALGSVAGAIGGLIGGIGSHSLAITGSGVNRWSGIALQALAAAGAPASWLPSLLRRMQQESGGNPNAINLWDSNAKAGHPSQGLMQEIPSTFAAYAGPYVSRGILDPFANIYASIKYANARYGAAPRGWDRPGGYKQGTPWVPNDQLALVHEGEGIIPRKVNELFHSASGPRTGSSSSLPSASQTVELLAEVVALLKAQLAQGSQPITLDGRRLDTALASRAIGLGTQVH